MLGVWNARSIVNKATFLHSLIYSKSLDIVCLSESWLTKSINDCELFPKSFTVYRRDRCSRGGGVLIAVSEKFPSRLISSSSSIEMIVVEIHLPPPIIVCCIYIPPASLESYLQDVLHSLHSLTYIKDTIIVGDFNVPDINWSTLSATSFFSSSLCNLIFSHNLSQLVTDPTHVGGNILDLVLTNNSTRVTFTSVDSNFCSSFSDHHLVTIHLHADCKFIKSLRPRSVLNYAKADYTVIESHLLDSDYSAVLSHLDVDSVWSNLKFIIKNICQLHIPRALVPPHCSPKWFNSDIRHLLKCVHTARRRAKKSPSCSRFQKLHLLETELGNMILTAKSQFEHNLVCSFAANPSKLFQYLSQLSSSTSTAQSIVCNSKIIHDSATKADIFNKFFNSNFTRSDYQLPPVENLPTPSLQLSTINIDSSDIFEALIQLNPSKAVGCDDISPRVLKFCATPLTVPITHLFSSSLESSLFIDEWKVHKIIPIPKKGDKSNPTNYRPISLLPILSKVFESLVYKKIISFVQPQISKRQFGFLKNRSCLTQLLLSFAEIINCIENKAACNVIYLDFSKAFDSVPHNELLFKLWRIGITGPLWYWFKDYLSNRRHYVCVDGYCSDTLPVHSGVPQGSILGPLLFLIYINDFPEYIVNSTPFIFADDTKLIMRVSNFNDQILLQNDLDSMLSWCVKWKINVNLVKTVVMLFSLAKSFDSPFFMLMDHQIGVVNTFRDLGVTVSGNLSWSNHINQLCSKAYASLHLIRRTISSSSVTLKKQLYFLLVRSKLTYCSQLWRPRLVKDINCLERIQRRSTKYILNDYFSDYKARLIQLNMLPLMYWFEIQDVMFVIKCIKEPPDNFNIFDYIKFNESSTRSSAYNHLKFNFCRTSHSRHFFFNRIVQLWNYLVPVIDLSLSLSTIRRHLCQHLWIHFTRNFDPNNTCTFHVICPCCNCHHLHHSTTHS